MVMFNFLNHPICLTFPKRLTPFSTWQEHIPFAMFLVDLLRPALIVELGTFYGDSYCVFCQAVQELNLDTRCFAVDTWKGDPHGGFYGDEVLADLRLNHDPHYGHFSTLIRSTFEESFPRFGTGTIDLLHIDGFHTYDAVKHDFETWLPKMSQRGVVLFHDTTELRDDFGVHTFWGEISQHYPHFEFEHGHGLGVLVVGRSPTEDVQQFLEAAEVHGKFIRAFFFELGHRLTQQKAQNHLLTERDSLIQEKVKLQSVVESQKLLLNQRDEILKQVHFDMEGKISYIKNLETTIDSLRTSLFMKTWHFYNRWKNILLPPNNPLRKGYDYLLRIMKGTKGKVEETSLTEHGEYSGLPNIYLIESPEAMNGGALPRRKPGYLPEDIDFVIVTFNSLGCIHRCLNSILRSDYETSKMNIFIIDNNSRDDITSVVDDVFKKSIVKNNQFIINSKNIGYGAAINKAVGHGKSPLIMVLNPDVELHPDCINNLISFALNDKVGWLWEARQLPYEHPKFYHPLTFETVWSSGAAFMMRRDKFEEIKGFEESYFLYAEDVDLSFKIRNRGGKLRYVPGAVVYHRSYSEPNEVKPIQQYYSVRNHLLLRSRFGSRKDIIEGYGRLLKLISAPPPWLKNRTAFLVKILAFMTKNTLAIVSWRLTELQRSYFKQYKFWGWDYELRKEGAFYEHRLPALSPLVSIIIRTKDRPKMLKSALKSVSNQTYPSIEAIVIEDGPPLSQSVINDFTALNVTYHATNESRGRCHAGNLGLQKSHGDYIGFLDDDDILYPDHIEVLVGALIKHLPIRLVYSASFEAQVSNEQGTMRVKTLCSIAHPYDREQLMIRNLFPIQAALFHRSLVAQCGGLNESYEILEDWDLWRRYSRKTDFLFIPKTTSEFKTPYQASERMERQKILDDNYYKILKGVGPER